jgi:hypothetical protein
MIETVLVILSPDAVDDTGLTSFLTLPHQSDIHRIGWGCARTKGALRTVNPSNLIRVMPA